MTTTTPEFAVRAPTPLLGAGGVKDALLVAGAVVAGPEVLGVVVTDLEVTDVVPVVGTLVVSGGEVVAVVGGVLVSGGEDVTEVAGLLLAGGGGIVLDGGGEVAVEDGGGVLTMVEVTGVVVSMVVEAVVVTTDEVLAGGGGGADVPHSVTVTVTVLTRNYISTGVWVEGLAQLTRDLSGLESIFVVNHGITNCDFCQYSGFTPVKIWLTSSCDNCKSSQGANGDHDE